MPYCTEAEIETFLSEEGVTFQADDNFDTLRESGAVSQAIEWADTKINMYCQAYAPAELEVNDWVNHCAIHLAARRLCMRRGNQVSGTVEQLYQEYMEELKAVHNGQLQIPDAAYRHSQTPSVTSVRIDPRYRVKKARVQRPLSTDQNTEGRSQPVDYGSEYPEAW